MIVEWESWWDGQYALTVFVNSGLSVACLAIGGRVKCPERFQCYAQDEYTGSPGDGEAIEIALRETEYGGANQRPSDFLFRSVQLNGRRICGLRPGHELWNERTMRDIFDGTMYDGAIDGQRYEKGTPDEEKHSLRTMYVETAALVFHVSSTDAAASLEEGDVPTDRAVLNALERLRWTD